MAVMAALSCEYAKRGHEVDVVCMDRSTGSTHERLWIDRLRGVGLAVRFLGRNSGGAGVTATARFWHLVQKRRYDVVHSHLPMPDAMSGVVRRASLRPFAHVVTVHNTNEPRRQPLGWLAQGAHVVYCSDAVRRSNALAGVSQTVIPNGIPQVSYARLGKLRVDVRHQLGLRQEAPVVIAVGRLCTQKGFDTALEALALLKRSGRIPDVECLVCGEGEARAELENLSEKLALGGVVHLLGTRVDIPRLLSASDVFLSTSRHEGMPLSVLEALSAGLPCVLSDIAEHYELAGSMPGCLFASRTSQATAAALESALLQMPSPALLQQSRAPLLRKHSAEQAAESYLALYARCCGARCVSEAPCC